MSIFKRVLFALISALTLYIGNVSNLPPKKGGGGSDQNYHTYCSYESSMKYYGVESANEYKSSLSIVCQVIKRVFSR